MFWKISADAVAIFHGLCVVAMVFGPVLAWRRPFWRGVHLFLLFVAVVAWSFYCPLSVAENVLRSYYDPGVGYQRGFLEYLAPIINLGAWGEPLAWLVRGWFVLWAILYGILWAQEARRAAPPKQISPRGSP